MPKCKMCEEKQTEIDRILSGYRKDKRTFAKEKKTYKIIIGVKILKFILWLRVIFLLSNTGN